MLWEQLDWKTLVSLTAVVAYLAPFILLQTGRMKAEGMLYSFLNLLGAGLILFTMTYQYNLASLLSNSVWAAFSLYGLYRSWSNKPVQLATEHQCSG